MKYPAYCNHFNAWKMKIIEMQATTDSCAEVSLATNCHIPARPPTPPLHAASYHEGEQLQQIIRLNYRQIIGSQRFWQAVYHQQLDQPFDPSCAQLCNEFGCRYSMEFLFAGGSSLPMLGRRWRMAAGRPTHQSDSGPHGRMSFRQGGNNAFVIMDDPSVHLPVPAWRPLRRRRKYLSH